MMSPNTFATALVERLRAATVDRHIGKHARIVEVHAVSVSSKIAVVEFAGQMLLLSVAREGVSLIAKSGEQ